MSPVPKPPKPIRRRARTPAKETQIEKRIDLLSKNVQYKVLEIDGLPESSRLLHKKTLRDVLAEREQNSPEKHLALKAFLENKGMGKEWRTKLNEQQLEMTAPILLELLANVPRPEAIHRGDHARIIKKMRRFLAAIEEAKRAGIT